MPNIDVSAIDGFETMTPEQKVEALLKVEVPEKVDMSLFVPKERADKYSSEAAAYKKQLDAKMSEEEKAAAERDAKWADMEAKLAKLEQEKMESIYKANYLSLGYEDALAEDTAKAMVAGNIEKVFANQKKAAEAAEKRIRADLTRQDPRASGSGGGNDDKEPDNIALAKKLGGRRKQAQSASDDIMKHYTTK